MHRLMTGGAVATMIGLAVVLGLVPLSAQQQDTGGPSESQCKQQGGTIENPPLGVGDDWYACCQKLPTPVNGKTKICSVCTKDGQRCTNQPIYRFAQVVGGEFPPLPDNPIVLGLFALVVIAAFVAGWLLARRRSGGAIRP